ncbi:hypothetical protein ISS40_06240 [Candidatus Bathyarchaeota archaeon]|nr:hypothetical protein [Candidatus Bathyarchaeota archaeon]
MTCYFRHRQMKYVFERAGVVITKENRKDVDRVIHSIVGVEYKSCPDTWRAVKAKLAEDEGAFIQELRSHASIDKY